MRDVIGGYSIHVYWKTRLQPLREPARHPSPAIGSRVRDGTASRPDFQTLTGWIEQGSVHGKNVEESIESGFQHAWFNALAASVRRRRAREVGVLRIDTRQTNPPAKTPGA